MADFLGEHGPYPDDWTPAQREFWNSEPNTYSELYEHGEWPVLQEAFSIGWLETGLTKEEHEHGRQDFYDLSGTQESSFDWDAFREYLHSIGS